MTHTTTSTTLLLSTMAIAILCAANIQPSYAETSLEIQDHEFNDVSNNLIILLSENIANPNDDSLVYDKIIHVNTPGIVDPEISYSVSSIDGFLVSVNTDYHPFVIEISDPKINTLESIFFTNFERTFDLTATLGSDSITRQITIRNFEPTPSTPAEEPRKRGGGGSEWQKKPTFGESWNTHRQLVSCGYSMDGICKDVMDYHVDYTRQIIHTNTSHDFTLKAYTGQTLKSMSIAFSVEEIGTPIGDAEATIEVILDRDYSLEQGYAVEEVNIFDPNNTIDYNGNNTSINLVNCDSSGSNQCVEITFNNVLFREQFLSEPFAIHAVDTDRRTTTHYMNDGLLVQGESLNPPPTNTAGIHKPGNQYDAIPIELVRIDKLADIWEDQFGNTWTKNNVNTWKQLTFSSTEQRADAATSVMTRTHSAHQSLIQSEQDRATIVFDSSAIQGKIGGTFAYDMPNSIDKLADPEILAKLAIENQKAMQFMQNTTY